MKCVRDPVWRTKMMSTARWVAGLVFVVASASACTASTSPPGYDYRLERPFKASLRRGMSREDLYSAARRLHLELRNSEYVVFKGNGPPVNNGSFPSPTVRYPHPTVTVFFEKPAKGCAIPTDEFVVFFDSRDRVANWSHRSIIVGGCI
jgi:hypothetical protein